MAIDYTQIDYQINYNDDNDPKDITLTDITNVPGLGMGIGDSDVTSILKGIMPDGTTFYEGNFGSPDIAHPSPLTADIPIVLDSEGKFILGKYNYDYTTRLASVFFDLAVTTLDDIAGTFEVAEDIKFELDQAIAAAVPFNIEAPGPPVNTAIVVISAETLVGGGTRVNYTPVALPAGPYAFQFTTDIDFVISREFDLETEAPKVCIDVEFSCPESTVTSTDQTDYGIGTIVRTHTVIAPPDIQPSPPGDTVSTDQIVIIPPNIFTGVYTTTISTDISYSFGNGFSMTSTVGGSDSVKVNCDNLFCTVSCGLETLNQKYAEVIAANSDPQGITLVVTDINLDLNTYLSFVACGDSVKANALAKVIIAKLDGCGCDCTACDDDDCDDEFPTEVIPITVATGVVLVTTPTTIFTQAGTPSPVLGIDGDLYINTTNGDYFLKVAGAWILQGNLIGPQGIAGTNGTNGIDGTNGTNGIDAFIYVGYTDDGAGGTNFSTSALPTSQFVNFITSNVALVPVFADFTDPWTQIVFSLGSINDHIDVTIPDVGGGLPNLTNDLHIYTLGNALFGSIHGWDLNGAMVAAASVIPAAGFNPVSYYISPILPFMPISGQFNVTANKLVGDTLFTIPDVEASFPSDIFVHDLNSTATIQVRFDNLVGPGFGFDVVTLTAITAGARFSFEGFQIRID